MFSRTFPQVTSPIAKSRALRTARSSVVRRAEPANAREAIDQGIKVRRGREGGGGRGGGGGAKSGLTHTQEQCPCSFSPQVYAEGRYEDALGIFERALDLPGTGMKRFRDKPAETSNSEKIAILYNCACCHSRLGNTEIGLVALAGALEAGYEDFKQLRNDPDLEALRSSDKFEGLVARFDYTAQGGPFGGLLFQLNPKNSLIYRSMNKK